MAGTSLVKYRQIFDGKLIEHRSTYLNDVDQLAAIQLAVLFIQKQVNVQDTLSSKDLFTLKKKISCEKLGKQNYSQLCTVSASASPMSASSVLDIVPFDDIFMSYVSFTKHCNMIDNGDIELFLDSKLESNDENTLDGKDAVTNSNEGDVFLSPISVNKATPIRSSHSTTKSRMQETTPVRSLHTPGRNVMTPSFPCSPKDPSNLQLRRIIISYLQLIVNSRNEIALARVIDLPTRGIDHKSFTDIRKLAVSKQMPMYQVISSFTRQCVLGGKGYAPREDHALSKHKEGLLDLMNLMDNLQTIVDEGESISSVLASLLKLLKTAFIRAKCPVFSPKSVSLVVQELSEVAKTKFLKNLKDCAEVGMFLLLRDYVDLVSCLSGNEVSLQSSQLCGILSTPGVSSTTYKKISTLVTNFTTPDISDKTPEKAEENEVDNKSDITENSKHMVGTPLSSGVCLDDADDEQSNLPIKLIRCPNSKVLADTKIKVAVSKPKHDIFNVAKNNERQVLKDVNTKVPAKRRPSASKSKAKCAKKIKLVSGQKSMNQFFSK